MATSNSFQDVVREIPASENLPNGDAVVGSNRSTFSVDPKGRAVVFGQKQDWSVTFYLVCSCYFGNALVWNYS